jgi:soluble lytic murein transglycosylase
MPPRCFYLLPLIAALLQTSAANADVAQTRSEFQRAYAQAGSNPPIAVSDSDALRAYVIYPYLQQARLKFALTQSKQDANSDRDIEAFLRGRENAPVTRDLRRLWYVSLAERKQWERLQNNFRDMNDSALRCHSLTARIALQQLDGVQAAALDLWSKASASLPACEPAFTWLRTQQQLTPAHIEQRARLSLSTGNVVFAKQLIADLPSDVAAPLIIWAHFIEQPSRFITAASKTTTGKKIIEPGALLDGWTRLARSDQNEAMRLYKPLVRSQQLPKETASRFALELALALAWNRHAAALSYFALVNPSDIDERGAEWYARAAIWAGDWQRTAKVIAAMPDALRTHPRWRYWEARAIEQLGDRSAAAAQYARLQGDDNYYAAMAAARLNKPYAPRQESLTVDAEQVARIEQQPPFERARELLATGLRTEAYDEWREGYGKLSSDARVQSIALAAQWGWHDQAITTAAQLRVFNDYTLLYPRPFDSEINAAAALTTLPAALIYSTLRQESLYRSDALSGAGAQGLMQLLPTTAKRTARRWQLSPPNDLFQPATNISIGAALLRDLQKSFGNTAAALSAYNAGPGAAQRWLTTEPKAADVWIENIPYNETRVYVQRVLWHSVVFGWVATGSAQDTSAWLQEVRKTSQSQVVAAK